jgi:hypothetical protein
MIKKPFPPVIFVNGQKCVMRLDPDTNLDQILTLSRSYREWGPWNLCLIGILISVQGH